MNIWLIIRTSFTNGYVLFDSAMVLLLSLLSVDVDTVVIVDVVAPYKQFTALLEKTGSWFQDDVIENGLSIRYSR